MIHKIKEKLDMCPMKYISRSFLDSLINRFAPIYSISDFSKRKFVIPIKKWIYYINKFHKERANPYIVWSLYFQWDMYVFGWLAVYNMYWFSTQVPEWYTIYNTKYSWEKIIDDCKFIFVKQRESFFYWIQTKKIWWYSVNVMTPERALIQIFKDDPSNEFIKNMPKNVDRKKIQRLIEKYSSRVVLDTINQLRDA